ncbi:MAG TPA: glycoside hydrolase family 97 protein [Puia sp.]
MRTGLLVILLVAAFAAGAAPRDSFFVASPSGAIRVKVWMGSQLRYSVFYDGKVLAACGVDLLVGSGLGLSVDDTITGSSLRRVDERIVSPAPEKRRIIPDIYNELTIRFRQPYTVTFRVYDDGVAHRIGLLFKDSVVIREEKANYSFAGHPAIYFPEVHKREDVDIFHTSFEELYSFRPMDSIDRGAIAFSPVLITPQSGPAMGITESDLDDYPGMFFQCAANSNLRGLNAPYPLEERINPGEFPQKVVIRRADYIAYVAGTRQLPWRVMLIAPQDKDLPGNDLVYRLGAPSRVADPSWVHPGKGTDEWIIHTNLFNVPFVSGVNTNTYKYYIDFAKKFGFDRIMMDAGWSNNSDLFQINPAINMDTLAAYARLRGIKLSMWTLALTLDRQLEPALEQFNKWGVDFIMTDFIDRDDQKTVQFYYRIAAACARHKIMIMYHGAYPPKGFNRTWPNAITRESVLGSEYNIWSDKVTPGHDLILPFTRMLAGALDYEPGILNNAAKGAFRMVEGNPMSQGTRCHQLAMFVVYDNPMPIFSGNPSQGMLEPNFMKLLGSVPAGWDTTVIVDARIGQYIVTARRKGKEWFIAGMTDWTERDLELPLAFLGGGKFAYTFCRDGVNASRYGSDYVIENGALEAKNGWRVHLAPGGGFLLRLRPE